MRKMYYLFNVTMLLLLSVNLSFAKILTESTTTNLWSSKETTPQNNNKTAAKKDFLVIVELGGAFKSGDLGANRFTADVIFAYQLNPYFIIGGGTGLRFYSVDPVSVSLPILAYFRLNFAKEKSVTPYLTMNFGNNFSFNGRGGRGFIYETAFGVQIKNFIVSVGYSGNNITYHYEGLGDISGFLGGFMIKAGFVF